MSASEIAARLVAALEAAAEREAGAKAPLVSTTVDILTQGSGDTIETEVLRRTRTLLFLRADLKTAAGAPIATANSVHKLES